MARTEYRDGREGRRRGLAGLMTSALCLLLVAGLSACGLDSPTSPNPSGDLTGQNPNQFFSFNGSIALSTSGETLVADGTSAVTVAATVRDAGGNPVPNLTSVTFTTDLGGFAVVDDDGAVSLLSAITGVTFNGVATAQLVATGGGTETATVTASLGQVVATAQVELEPAPINGTLALSFGPDGSGETVMAGTATSAQPLDVTVGVTALDEEGNPVVGATVEFHFVVDTTNTGDFVTGDDVLTGPDGNATNLLRVSDSGDIAIEASLVDPNTGEVVAVSNRIFLTTGVALLPTLEFGGGGASFSAVAPYTAPIVATITDTEGDPQEGLTVRFTIVDDSTNAGASVTTGIGVTNAAGQVASGIVVPDAGGGTSTVTVVAEVVDTNGEVVSSTNVVVATGT